MGSEHKTEDTLMEMPEEVWIATYGDGFIITWRNKPEVMTATRFIPASRESALQERVERAEALLNESREALVFLTGAGVCTDPNCRRCTETRQLISRISTFTQEKP